MPDTRPPPELPLGLHRFCLDCCYRVDNLTSAACPECGRRFDLAHALSTRGPARLTPLDHWARARVTPLGQPSRYIWPGTLAVVITSLIVSAFFFAEIALPMLALCLGFTVVGFPYLVRAACRRHLVNCQGLPPQILGIDRPRIRKARATFAITAALILLRAPLYVFFFASLPSLNQAADYEWNVRPGSEPQPRWASVGLIPVERVVATGNGVAFVTPGGAAFCYEPVGRGPHPSVHLYGDWYLSPAPFRFP